MPEVETRPAVENTNDDREEHLVDVREALYVRDGRISAYVKANKLKSTEGFQKDLAALVRLEEAAGKRRS